MSVIAQKPRERCRHSYLHETFSSLVCPLGLVAPKDVVELGVAGRQRHRDDIVERVLDLTRRIAALRALLRRPVSKSVANRG